MKTDKDKVSKVVLSPLLKKRLKTLAAENGTTIKAIVDVAVEYYLNHVERHKAQA